jgi:ribosomal protein S18 acetylase RimI-like enzyme
VSATGGRWEKAAEAYATGEHRAGRELELVVEYAAPTGTERVLDIGTGAGHTALALARRVSDVVLTDPVDAMLAAARRLQPFLAPLVVVRFLEADPRHPSTLRAVGELDGQIAGRASIGTVDGVAELYGVVTDPPFRRRGVAATICSALIERLFDDGGTLVFLDAENPGAQALYERLGFHRIGARLTYTEPPS